MKHYQITLNGRTFDIRLLSDPLQEQVEVEVDGKVFTVEVKVLPSGEDMAAASVTPAIVPPPAVVPHPSVETASPSGATVTAPLPGVIKSIAVRQGQQVSPGDPLFVIEAMKMDNVIRATRQGVVQIIHVAEGHRVAHGEPMLEYRD